MSFFSPHIGPTLLICISLLVTGSILLLTRFATILVRPQIRHPRSDRCHSSRPQYPTHLFVVLGSGGHTTEMLDALSQVPSLGSRFTHRTYMVTSGDKFSANKAAEFETRISSEAPGAEVDGSPQIPHYIVVTVQRARKVHQSLLLTPWSAMLCIRDCLQALRGAHPDQRSLQISSDTQVGPIYPDLILTNGPGSGVCVVLAAIILRFLGYGGPSFTPITNKAAITTHELPQWQESGQMRSVYIESWARVTTLSLSGKILLPFVDRFLVQWPAQAGKGGGKSEFLGSLVM